MKMSLRSTFVRGGGLAALALAGLAAHAPAQQLPAAAQVVDRYVEAIGGRAAIGRHGQRKMVTELSIPAQGMTIAMETYTARPNRMAMKAEVPGMGTMSSGYDGTVAWSTSPVTGPRIITGKEAAEALRQANFDASTDLARAFPTMETVGEKSVGGRACWNLRMVTADSVEVHSCFDKETGLLVSTSVVQSSAMGDIPVEIVVSDYRDFDGVKMPTRMTMSLMGQEMVTTVKSVSHEPFDAAVFALPPEIRALVPPAN
ncbi:MAG TPA: DUF620 domain-containing protein [Longimicrobiaceae bacterium]|nr:DUF620 domain-containing protein [Longimicrobiaceae bacterium]